jgi:hypothetical protein
VYQYSECVQYSEYAIRYATKEDHHYHQEFDLAAAIATLSVLPPAPHPHSRHLIVRPAGYPMQLSAEMRHGRADLRAAPFSWPCHMPCYLTRVELAPAVRTPPPEGAVHAGTPAAQDCTLI